jgi:hypothetical protein
MAARSHGRVRGDSADDVVRRRRGGVAGRRRDVARHRNSSRIARTGFHPLDGAVFLHAEGFPDRLAGLIAHHSLAVITAPLYGVHDLAERFSQEQSLLVDALVYADMHSAPDGRIVGTEWRLADIARRRPGPHQDVRAELLRASIRRVEAAIRDPERRIEVPPRAPA